MILKNKDYIGLRFRSIYNKDYYYKIKDFYFDKIYFYSYDNITNSIYCIDKEPNVQKLSKKDFDHNIKNGTYYFFKKDYQCRMRKYKLKRLNYEF